LHLFREVSPAGSGQGVKLGAAAAFQFAPLAINPTFFLQPVQSRKKGSGSDHKNSVGHLFDAVRDTDSMQRLEFERTENEEIESPLEERHMDMISTLDIDCQ
jgi:hypothetical protein